MDIFEGVISIVTLALVFVIERRLNNLEHQDDNMPISVEYPTYTHEKVGKRTQTPTYLKRQRKSPRVRSPIQAALTSEDNEWMEQYQAAIKSNKG